MSIDRRHFLASCSSFGLVACANAAPRRQATRSDAVSSDMLPMANPDFANWLAAFRPRARRAGIKDFDRIYLRDELATADVIFAATGVTQGSMLDGIKSDGLYLTSETLLMRSKTGSMRRMSYRVPIDHKLK